MLPKPLKLLSHQRARDRAQDLFLALYGPEVLLKSPPPVMAHVMRRFPDIEFRFESFDKDKDSFIDFDEFSSYSNIPQQAPRFRYFCRQIFRPKQVQIYFWFKNMFVFIFSNSVVFSRQRRTLSTRYCNPQGSGVPCSRRLQ